MINTLKSPKGFIYAYIEWQILDASGQFKDNGEYIYVQEVWIHPEFRGAKILNQLITMVDEHKFARNASFVYWTRDKYNDRTSRIFSRGTGSRKGVHYGQQKEFIPCAS